MRIPFVLFAVATAACTLEVDYTGTFYQCGEGGTCPDGYSCVQNLCLPEEPPPPACSTSVAAGGLHSCAIRADQTLWCWGRNNFGQLGDGTKASSSVPVQVMGISGAIAVTTGAEHTCAIVDGGTAYCWGRNEYGQIGDGTMGDSTTPSMLPLTAVTAIGAGDSFSCAIANGTVSCWGDNEYGQVGDGTMTARLVPTSTGFSAGTLAVAGDSACAIDASGEARCWGETGHGQFGLGTTDPEVTPTRIGTGIAEIAIGRDHLCLRRTDDRIECAGRDDSGQLGYGYRGDSDQFVQVPLPIRLTHLTSRNAHTCGLDDAKRPWCWGYGEDGRLLNGRSFEQGYAVRSTLEDIVGISAGDHHTCAVTGTGEVYCGGWDGHGQLGNGFATTRSSPLEVAGVTGVKEVALGGEFTCALQQDKTVTCWGEGRRGEIANGGISSPIPTFAIGLVGIKRVRAGGAHACALDESGTLWCWGQNEWGQLGDGTDTANATPQVVDLPGAVSDFATGTSFTCAIVSGNVWCWGANDGGQSGQAPFGNGSSVGTPAQVSMISGATKIAAGDRHACAIVAGNTVKCWGAAYYGGLGTTMDTATAVPVDAQITNVTEISARGAATFAISGGALWGWGWNCDGQLTQGSCNPNLPAALAALANVTDVGPGFGGGCGLRNGTVVCWGTDYVGQAGDARYAYSVPPTQVAGLDQIVDVESGGEHACAVHTSGSVSCWGNGESGQLGDGHVAPIDPVGAQMVCE